MWTLLSFLPGIRSPRGPEIILDEPSQDCAQKVWGQAHREMCFELYEALRTKPMGVHDQVPDAEGLTLK
ncbi:hypothetical protein AV530_019553 [Patagioenas fasciata monilis]|uniref:Uncharacterized protein n=1 Tax=Patagioenas fasciata monilis TaxID=372326 RepID=A0A1V4JDR0_PATFA|nr:hypothetical protein AV530_019553 [Patagioenas fasciata monilis]